MRKASILVLMFIFFHYGECYAILGAAAISEVREVKIRINNLEKRVSELEKVCQH